MYICLAQFFFFFVRSFVRALAFVCSALSFSSYLHTSSAIYPRTSLSFFHRVQLNSLQHFPINPKHFHLFIRFFLFSLLMSSSAEEDSQCLRCHAHPKLFETFKSCVSCSRRHCQQCWGEMQLTDDHRLLMDLVPKMKTSNRRRLCPSCTKVLLEQALASVKEKKAPSKIDADEEYQLALAMSLSQREAEEHLHRKKRKSDAPHQQHTESSIIGKAPLIDPNELLLDTTREAIERFMNRAKSNCESMVSQKNEQ